MFTDLEVLGFWISLMVVGWPSVREFKVAARSLIIKISCRVVSEYLSRHRIGHPLMEDFRGKPPMEQPRSTLWPVKVHVHQLPGSDLPGQSRCSCPYSWFSDPPSSSLTSCQCSESRSSDPFDSGYSCAVRQSCSAASWILKTCLTSILI